MTTATPGPSNIRALPPRHAAAIHRWVHLVAEHHGLTVGDLRSSSRAGGLPRIRWVAMLLMHQDGMSQARIAAQLGLSHPSTIGYGIDQAANTSELADLAARIREAGEIRRPAGLVCVVCQAPAVHHPEWPGTRHIWDFCHTHEVAAAATLNGWIDDQWGARVASRIATN